MSRERRSDAFQNIFGRPSASHHKQNYYPQHHQRVYQQPPTSQQQQYFQQYYYGNYGYDYDQYYRSQSAMGFRQPYYQPSTNTYATYQSNSEELPTSTSSNSQYSSSSAYAIPTTSSSASYLSNFHDPQRLPNSIGRVPPSRSEPLMEVDEDVQNTVPPPAYSQG